MKIGLQMSVSRIRERTAYTAVLELGESMGGLTGDRANDRNSGNQILRKHVDGAVGSVSKVNGKGVRKAIVN